MTSRARWGGVDGLRALAALSVISYHMGPLHLGGPVFARGGWLGVDVFFTLSGFLITTSCLAGWRSDGVLRVRRFYLRRVVRLYPALAVLAVGVLVATATLPALVAERASDTSNLVPALTMWLNVRVAANGPVGMFVHLWSLSLEEQFYLLWAPVLALCIGRVQRRHIALGLLTVAIALPVTRTLLASTMPWATSGRNFAYFSPLHSEGLFVGCALAFAIDAAPPVSRLSKRWIGLTAACGATLVVLVAHSPVTPTTVAVAPLALPIAVSPVIATCVWWPSSLLARALSWRPLAWIGVRSYAVYLWQLPVIVLVFRDRRLHALGGPAQWGVVLGMTLLAAALSWVLAEKPTAALRRRYEAGGLAPRHVAPLAGSPPPRPGAPTGVPKLDRLTEHWLWAWPLRIGEPEHTDPVDAGPVDAKPVDAGSASPPDRRVLAG